MTRTLLLSLLLALVLGCMTTAEKMEEKNPFDMEDAVFWGRALGGAFASMSLVVPTVAPPPPTPPTGTPPPTPATMSPPPTDAPPTGAPPTGTEAPIAPPPTSQPLTPAPVTPPTSAPVPTPQPPSPAVPPTAAIPTGEPPVAPTPVVLPSRRRHLRIKVESDRIVL
jgi:hypothetical protein